MAYGDGPADESLRTAWRAFCERLQAAGDFVFKEFSPVDPMQRADAFRYMTQNLGQAFDLALETRDTRYPQIHDFCNPTRKLGGDNADFLYQQAWIDGASHYRITGNRGTCRFLNISVQGPRPAKQPGTDWPSLHEPFGDLPQASITAQQLVTEWDGAFELFIGGPQRGKNWLPTNADSRKLFIRHGFDRWEERPALMRIERIDMDEPKPLPTPEVMIEAMEWAGDFMHGVMGEWPEFPFLYTNAPYLSHINAFPGVIAYDKASDKIRGRAIDNMAWAIEPDEALIMEFDDHEGLWSATNMGAFFNSLDYLYRPVSYTPSRTKVDGDGKIRLVITHSDPGYHNWVDTQGFTRGNLTYRCLMSDHLTELRTKLVKVDDLSKELPADTVKVSSEERIEQMRARFNGIRQRYGI